MKLIANNYTTTTPESRYIASEKEKQLQILSLRNDFNQLKLDSIALRKDNANATLKQLSSTTAKELECDNELKSYNSITTDTTANSIDGGDFPYRTKLHDISNRRNNAILSSILSPSKNKKNKDDPFPSTSIYSANMPNMISTSTDYNKLLSSTLDKVQGQVKKKSGTVKNKSKKAWKSTKQYMQQYNNPKYSKEEIAYYNEMYQDGDNDSDHDDTATTVSYVWSSSPDLNEKKKKKHVSFLLPSKNHNATKLISNNDIHYSLNHSRDGNSTLMKLKEEDCDDNGEEEGRDVKEENNTYDTDNADDDDLPSLMPSLSSEEENMKSLHLTNTKLNLDTAITNATTTKKTIFYTISSILIIVSITTINTRTNHSFSNTTTTFTRSMSLLQNHTTNNIDATDKNNYVKFLASIYSKKDDLILLYPTTTNTINTKVRSMNNNDMSRIVKEDNNSVLLTKRNKKRTMLEHNDRLLFQFITSAL